MTDWRTNIPLPGTGIRVRAGAEIMQLVAVMPRRWWQLWKPRLVTHPLETAEYRLKANDRISLTRIGACYAVTVNDTIVLQWPPGESACPEHGVFSDFCRGCFPEG